MNASIPLPALQPRLRIAGLAKHFTLHHRNRAHLPVFDAVDLEIAPGECVVLDGPSGLGKSTLLKLVYANYRASAGCITVRTDHGEHIDVARADAQTLVRLRQETMGYVSQFLRVIPRVPALDVVAEPLLQGQCSTDAAALEQARNAARALLARLHIPERLWHLPPATFSGGEQQRINIARNMIRPKSLLLLDEPTASLDAANTATVVELIREAVARGAAVLGIFHDAAVGRAVATRHIDVAQFRSTP